MDASRTEAGRREHDALPSARPIVKLSTARIGGGLTGVAAASSVKRAQRT